MIPEDKNISFDSLYSKYKARMVRFAQSYLSADTSLAEDIVADAFTYYWEHRNILSDNDCSPAGYIFSIVRTRCLNQLKKERKSVAYTGNKNLLWEIDIKLASLHSDDPKTLFASEIEERINRTIGELPEKTRRIFYLKKIKGKKYSEIAAMLNISEKTVEFHMSKALKSLRKALSDYFTR